MSTLDGKIALITGASSGIGAALAHELGQRGCRVGLLARREDRLRTLSEELHAAGIDARWAAADVTDDAGLCTALETLAEGLGGIDIAVANAGFGRPESPQRFKPGRALGTYDVNLLGTLRVIDWALPRFLAQGSGHLVAVASVASYFGLPHAAAYCGSKAAIRIHFESLRLSLRRHNVAVTTLCPGFVVSELTDLNPGPMPFLWPTERAARKMADSIQSRRREVIFPWQMKLFISLISRLPGGLRCRLLARMPGI